VVNESCTYNWHIGQHLQPPAFVAYWKDLATLSKLLVKDVLRFGPLDAAKGLATVFPERPATLNVDYTFVKLVQTYLVQAIHHHHQGWVTIPYELLFYQYDCEDGSDCDGDACSTACSIGRDKLDFLRAVLDWAVKTRLRKAFVKNVEAVGANSNSSSSSSLQRRDRVAGQRLKYGSSSSSSSKLRTVQRYCSGKDRWSFRGHSLSGTYGNRTGSGSSSRGRGRCWRKTIKG
jgi:hypothetical protein